MRKYLLKITLLMTCIFLFLPTTMIFCYSEAAEKVRYGYFDLGKYYSFTDGEMISYDSEYLKMIGKDTNLEFEYVNCHTWDNALEMLRNHKIDLVGTMQWTLERENEYAICNSNYGYTLSEIAVLERSDLIYEDYNNMNGIDVGYIEGYVIEDKIKELMSEKNLSFNLIPHKNQTDLNNALENEDIDAVAGTAHSMNDSWRVIEKFSYSPMFFASWKGNEQLTELITEEIIKIHIHYPEFDDNLVNKFFPTIVNFPYNKEEIDFINQNKDINIYNSDYIKPLIWHENGEVKGVLVDVIKEINEKTGLNINIYNQNEAREIGEAIINYKSVSYENKYHPDQNKAVTDSILDQTYELFHRIGDTYHPDGEYTIGIVSNRQGLIDYLNDKYPRCTVVEFDSPKDCLNSLTKKKIDLTFLNTYVYQNNAIENNIKGLTNIPMSEEIFGVSLEFRGESAELLKSIVNKAGVLIDQSVIDEALLKYALNTTPEITFGYMFENNVVLFSTIMSSIVIIIIIIFVLLTYAIVMRKQRDHIEVLNRERNDFFARMSHDMRTPMNGILGMIELTRQSNSLDEVKENMIKAKISGDYMVGLINDTLDLQKLESRRLELDKRFVSAREFLDGVIDMVQPNAGLKNISLEVECNAPLDDYIEIDNVRLKQIFINILSNAVKFTPKNGGIKVVINRLSFENNKSHNEIIISDTGIGMSNEFIENNLFTPYSQERNHITQAYSGSGLGLAIAKNLVELMDGSISVSSELGEGTTFRILLDLKHSNKGYSLKEESNTDYSQYLSGKKILVCEDHPLNMEIVKKILKKVGCFVSEATNGEEGFKTFDASGIDYFDAILMDVRMPVLDGIEATKKIRNLDRADALLIPILAMTANAYDSDKENCFNAGMNSHLAKPLIVSDLYRELIAQIKSRKYSGDDNK